MTAAISWLLVAVAVACCNSLKYCKYKMIPQAWNWKRFHTTQQLCKETPKAWIEVIASIFFQSLIWNAVHNAFKILCWEIFSSKSGIYLWPHLVFAEHCTTSLIYCDLFHWISGNIAQLHKDIWNEKLDVFIIWFSHFYLILFVLTWVFGKNSFLQFHWFGM